MVAIGYSDRSGTTGMHQVKFSHIGHCLTIVAEQQWPELHL